MSHRHWLGLVLTLSIALPASAFDLSEFQRFLQDNQDLTAQELLRRHEPVPHHESDLALDTSGTIFLQEVIDAFDLTHDELALLSQNGFVVSERGQYPSYGALLNRVWHADLPIFISSDLILHSVHVSFADVFKAIEQGSVAPTLVEALGEAHASWATLDASHGTNPLMRASLDDLDVWITVARSLLSGTPAAAASGTNDAQVATILSLIDQLQPAQIALFNDAPRLVDFSQFQVRGYYTETVELQRYFRAMMWIGRTDFRLSPPPGPTAIDVQREVVDAFLLRELFDLADVRDEIGGVDALLSKVVGESDNTTLDQLDQIATDLQLDSAAELWSPATYAAFQAVLDSDAYQPQAINSRILMKDPLDPEPLRPPYAFLVLGQRFTIDSHVLGNVVYDKVALPFRGLPSPMDLLYALGNDDAIALLGPELEYFGYAPQLAALRYLIDSYDEGFWSSSLYNHWLAAIRTLNRSGQQPGAPDFMRTGAWQQKQMQTQLVSWSELRHDTILHVKQSYSSGVICSNPHGYVEPVPGLYRRLGAMARFAQTEIAPLVGDTSLAAAMAAFYTRVEQLMQQLEAIATKELGHQPLTEEEELFLQSSYAKTHISCGHDREDGWLADLYFDRESEMPISTPDFVVADVHTQPTDEAGAMVGRVLHVGTVHPRLAVVVAGCPTSEPIAFVGPVGSMRQFVSSGFDRLTDADWEQAWFEASSAPESWFIRISSEADWEKIYTTDGLGHRQSGPSILDAFGVGVTDPGDGPPRPDRHGIAWLRNRPNPFNPRTQIAFELAGQLPVPVRVAVYDARGQRVRTLLDEVLQPNTWLLPWDGTDQSGRAVASGVYFAVVDADGRRHTTKMVMVR